MDKKIAILLFVIILLLCVNTISAVPPVTTMQQFTEGFDIRIPQDNILKLDSPYEFEIHVYNISNGYPITSGISCYFHLYNSSGEHQLELQDNSVSHNFDYSFAVSGGNFSNLGAYYANFNCNSSTLGGFASDIIRVTYNGEEISSAHSILYGSLFFVFLFFMISLVFIINLLPSSDTKDEEGKILSISYLKYLRPALWFMEWMLFVAVLYLSSNIAFAYLGEQLFANILFVLFRITFGFTPVIVVVWFVWMFVKMFHDKQLQNIINRGIFPQGKL